MSSGENVYHALVDFLGSPKAASEFLYRAGIDGITYIGDSSNVRNYVAFSDKDIRVDEHIMYRKKILHRQIIPVVRNGVVQDEYADLLANKEYTPTTLAELQDKALDWILHQGGIVQAAEKILKNQAPSDTAVAELARCLIINSDVFANDVSKADRIKLNTLEIDARSRAGLTLRSMRLDSLNLKDVAAVQALLNKLHKDMPPADIRKLREQIKKELDIDIYDLPDDIVNNKSRLDALLRKELAHKASWQDKIYEAWINGILSGPATHTANLFGNTANAVYELGLKRFVEALVNVAAGKKDGASFGEFKQMVRAFNWSNAWRAATKAWDLEALDPNGKFLEDRTLAIDGKTGRFIRIPGRALKAADALARALIEPMETAAYAYRMGVGRGLSGKQLQEHIENELINPASRSYQWAKERSRTLVFQEDPGAVIKSLMALRESEGALGIALKLFLPFLKTPANILRQGIRKSPLGAFNFAYETGKAIAGKRKFDGEYIARAAEQLIAWGAFMAVAGLSDDDEPFLTGSSAQYGSPEYGFKANKIPPYSIRIGGAWYSYQRIEPLATGLAAIADGLSAWRNFRNGKEGTAVMKDIINSGKQIIVEKSYIDSIGELVKAFEDPQRYGIRPVSNLLSSAMPALIRQTRQAFTEEVGDNRSRNTGRDWWLDQMQIVVNRAGITTAIPKIDYFGRPIKKDDWGDSPLSLLGRLMPFKRFEADSNMDKAERLIWNYNQRHPNDEYYPNVPQHTFSYNGVKKYFSGEDYKEYAVQAGQLAHRQINNAIRAGRLNVNNPDAEDIKLIKKIFSRARKETQQKLIKQAKEL